MALTRDKKTKVIEKLEKNIAEQKIMLFVGIAKIKTKDLFDLKNKLKDKGNILMVAKKTLFKIASKKKGVEVDAKKLDGELAIIFGKEDEISAAKLVKQFSLSNDNLKILGGVFENQLVGQDKVLALADIPSRQELLSNAVGSIYAPVTNFVGVLSGNLRGLVRVLSQIKK